ncbi:MFS transporter [Terrilactibacillus sp. BCM23-1]|uniref:MFS transporter n=1 Tax=Terrilactibacillus tamarindi TaxID=2599694 RepID=A0A6N8CSE0_9BACI|nr:MFS transporter [Terrilactibacillus tamarindi]MTT33074.1 MFS transporter [Terrilactibacillus tamarindi]
MSYQSNESFIADRMNRIPKSNYFLRLVARISLGGFFEYYDIFLVGVIGAALIHEKLLTMTGLAYFVSAGFLGMFFGTTIFGRLGDRLGRRPVFVYSMLIYSVFTIFMAFSNSAITLDIFRLCAGIGIGAQLVIADTYVSEMTPKSARGFYIAFGQFISFLAVPVVTFLTYFLVSTHFLIDGWRWVVLIGASGSIVVWWIRMGLPESARWLEKKGYIDEANQVMTQIEGFVKKENGELPPIENSTSVESSKGNFKEIWQKPYRSRTIMMVVFNFFQTIGFYGFASWVPTFLVHEGITLVHSLLFTSIIALVNPVGAIIAMYTSDRFERKHLIVVVSLSVAIAGSVFAMMRIPVWIIVMGILVTLLNNWFSSLFHSYQAELYPTRLRATGVGFTASCGRLSSVFSGVMIAFLLEHAGITGVFTFMSGSMLIVACSIGFFGPKTKNLNLEDIGKRTTSTYKAKSVHAQASR